MIYLHIHFGDGQKGLNTGLTCGDFCLGLQDLCIPFQVFAHVLSANIPSFALNIIGCVHVQACLNNDNNKS